MSNRTLPIYLLVVVTFTGYAARNFLLPLYAHDLGVGRSGVGLLFTAFAIASAALSLPAGRLVDRLGRRNMLLASGAVGLTTQLAVAHTTDLRVMLLWQVVAGVGGAALQTAMTAAIIDAVPHRGLARATGWLTFCMQGGFLLGPALGGLGTRFYDVRTDLVATTALFIPALILGFAVPHGRPQPSGPRPNLRVLLAISGVPALLVGILGSAMLYGTFSAFMPVFGKEYLRLPESEIGLLIGVAAIFNGLSRISSGRIVERLRRRGPVTAACMTGFALLLGVLPWLHGFAGPAIDLALAMPLVALCWVALGTTFNQLAPPEARGLASGLYSTAMYFGLSAGPALYGPVMQSAGYRTGFAACAAVSIGLAGVMILIRPRALAADRPTPGPTVVAG